MTDNVDDLLLELSVTRARTGEYEDLDRFREFRELFLGSEKGKRVLHQLLAWGHVYKNSASSGNFDPYRTLFHEGERNIALKIMATVTIEPKPRPTRAVSVKPE